MPRRLVLAAAAAGLLLSACTTGSSPSHPPSPTSSTPATPASRTAPSPTTRASTSPTPSATQTPRSVAAQLLARLTLAQRVGQLFMVDCPSSGVSAATIAAIQQYGVGAVILDGNNSAGVEQLAAITAQLQQLAPRGLALFVATDQEGGLVQRLRGSGFSDIPSALVQGQWSPAALRTDATVWGGQLRAAGVNVDLAPVLDTVPVGFGPNPPIGDLDREYGHDPATVAAHGVAFARGMAAAGVDATVKHFPGLGRVTGNTDTTSGVSDTVTTRDDPYLTPFADAIKAGVAFVMMSTAIYTHLDPNRPAAFSKAIVTTLLRERLGFTGVVISDDLGGAAQVSGYSIGARAVDFIAAGGDMVLTVDASQAPAMTAAVIARAQVDPVFAALVDAAALRVLTAKEKAKLLGTSGG